MRGPLNRGPIEIHMKPIGWLCGPKAALAFLLLGYEPRTLREGRVVAIPFKVLQFGILASFW